MKIYATRAFMKIASKENVTDEDLLTASDRAARGLIDGAIGKFLVKLRIPRPNQGRARGLRAIAAYKPDAHLVFLFLFPKSARANLDADERGAYQDYAETLAVHTDADFARLVAESGWRLIE